MPVTPETLTRHELNGLRVEVVDAPNPDLVGISGRVVSETMRTLVVESSAGDATVDGTEARARRVPKRDTTFQFALSDAPAARPAGAGEKARPGTAADPHRADRAAATHTDEAAGGREAPGTASEPVSTPGNPERARVEAGYGTAYVTVDGARLLSRPALRTENAGDTRWR